MTKLTPAQFGICSWSTHPKDPEDLAGRLKELGLTKIQLYVTPVYAETAVWGNAQADLAKHGVTIVSGMFGTKGEDYSTMETIRKTGGFVPDEHWPANWETVQRVVEVTKKLRIPYVSSHAGFLPGDKKHPSFAKLVDRIGKVARHFATANATLLFETGQETADTLWQFLAALDEVGASNTGVNFDPANMLLYDKGDPIASLRKLVPRVKQVHIKDGIRTKTPGAWGTEVPIGEGEVDWKSFMKVLAEADYKGDLVIEREAGQDRVGDVRKAIERLSKLM
ncbi:MAG: sugar phosphate isomerase/epimerase [Planctomycetes bacterium]|nr:sugar phosphate isomerase/epimerase [Planctomycetota bacterium]